MIMAGRKKARGLGGGAFLAAQLANAEVRHHFEQRRLIHEVAVAVRSMRAAAGLTQAQLARRIGTSQPTIARLEKGLDVRTPRWDTLHRIAVALGRQLKLRFAPAEDPAPLVEVGRPRRRVTSSAPAARGG
jgi:DNA-binding XRE family transcriptional regulator